MVIFSCGDDGQRNAAQAYADAWSKQDFSSMYGRLSKKAQDSTSLDAFVSAQADGLATATVRRLAAGRAGEPDNGIVKVPFTVETRTFGTLKLDALIPVTGDGENARVDWNRSLVLPGLKPGETLSRTTTLPPRASILAADGTPLAEGPSRSSPIPDVASEIAGRIGNPSPGSETAVKAMGYPAGTKVGINGLERVYQARLAGRPGGTLKAGDRVLARSNPKASPPLRSTIVPEIERAAASAMGGRSGGIAVMDPRTGEILALAGSAFSGTGPPGSTFKMITASAALESGTTTMTSTFPFQSQTTIDGRSLQNANGEVCGGTLVQAFAESCNSVFVPMGIKTGAERLVSTAEKFGFNKPFRNIPAAAISEIPPASQMKGEEAVGTSAIGQGQVMASPLEMTTVGAAIANGGVRVEPTLLAGDRPIASRAISVRTANAMRTLMLAVVRNGTGTSAAISGVPVAGKTGTAELTDTTAADAAGNPANTDAWFVAFAPAYAPRLAIGVQFNRSGQGGQTAAPAAHDVLITALRTHRR